MLPAMAIDKADNTHQVKGNDSLTSHYSIPFRIDDPKWLRLQRLDPDDTVHDMEQGADYVVHEDDYEGWVFTTPLAAIPCTAKILMARYTPATQELSLVPNAPLPAKTLEKTLDQIVMALQDRDANPKGVFSKALVFPMSEPKDHDTELDPPHLRKDTVLYFSPEDGRMQSLSMLNLAQKISALIGILGPRGPMGPQGYRGLTGYRGPVGYRGPYGYQGAPGGRGEQGLIGPTGFPGMPGEDGEDGADGMDGRDGIDGIDGINGLPGPRGPTGYRGPEGYRGPQGYPGADGADGADGENGTCECTCGY